MFLMAIAQERSVRSLLHQIVAGGSNGADLDTVRDYQVFLEETRSWSAYLDSPSCFNKVVSLKAYPNVRD